MNHEAKIEQLTALDKPELIDLFSAAFRDTQPIPVFKVKPELEKRYMRATFDYVMGKKNTLLYGIREDGKIVCALLASDSLVKPSVLASIKFFIPMIALAGISLPRAMGWRKAKEFVAFIRKVYWDEMPRYEERYFILEFFGTLPAYQRRGFGRKVLRFLYEKAKNEGCRGIIVSTSPAIPGFYLYRKEGFKVEKEFTLGEITLCWMRFTF